MSCYYHPKLATLTICRECGHELCSACAADDVCPGCKLARAMNLADPARRVLNGANANGQAASGSAQSYGASTSSGSRPAVTIVEQAPSSEDRLLSALCYPLWPVALLMLFLPAHRGKFVRFNVMQALAVNAIGVALYVVYAVAAHLPVIGWQSAFMVPFLMPVWFLIDLYLAARAYGGNTTRVPIAADFASRYAG